MGGGGDGLRDVLGRSLSIDGGEGDISTNSVGECNGDKIRGGFFSSLIGFVWTGNGFFFGIIFDVWGFLFNFGGIGSFLIGLIDWDVFSGWVETDCVYDVDGR